MTPNRPVSIPDGFELTPPRGPFTGVNGPLWKKPGGAGELPVFGFLPEERHTNGLGFVHGGMVATFLDTAMAQTIFEQFGSRLVTLKLEVTYLNVAPKGRWCEAYVRLETREGDRLNASADLVARRQICASSKATFKLFL